MHVDGVVWSVVSVLTLAIVGVCTNLFFWLVDGFCISPDSVVPISVLLNFCFSLLVSGSRFLPILCGLFECGRLLWRGEVCLRGSCSFVVVLFVVGIVLTEFRVAIYVGEAVSNG